MPLFSFFNASNFCISVNALIFLKCAIWQKALKLKFVENYFTDSVKHVLTNVNVPKLHDVLKYIDSFWKWTKQSNFIIIDWIAFNRCSFLLRTIIGQTQLDRQKEGNMNVGLRVCMCHTFCVVFFFWTWIVDFCFIFHELQLHFGAILNAMCYMM